MIKENKPTVLDLFSGTGGLSIGFSKAGYNIVGAVDIDTDSYTNIVRMIGNSVPPLMCYNFALSILKQTDIGGIQLTIMRI